MLITLSLFAFALMELTQDFEQCVSVCLSFLWLARSLAMFMIALFTSQMSLYHMCYEQIKSLKMCKLIMLQHGGFNYEVKDVLRGSRSQKTLSSTPTSHHPSQYSSNYVETEAVDDEEADRTAHAIMCAFDEEYE